MKNRPFCQRNLKPLFALLVLLIAATIVWAIVSHQKKIANRAGQRAETARRHRAAQPPPAAERVTKVANTMVDAVSRATPNGGITLIGLPRTRGPFPVFGPPRVPVRLELVAARPGNRHVFNTVSALILPTVVSIHATRKQPANPALGTDRWLRFADPFDGVQQKVVRNKTYGSVGSGFIIDSRGYILTNYHVISQATDLLVSISGNLKGDYPATTVAVAPAADLALIRVSGAPALPEARLGDSPAVQVGDWVLAFGSPFGLDQTVTQGIISSRRKALVVDDVSYGEMLQTDAPINRGSSGGPLVNLKAEVIGINSAIYGPGGIFSGAGFAIPVDRAKGFLARFSQVFRH